MTEKELIELANYSDAERSASSIKVYGCDKPLRQFGFYPSWLPLCVASEHGPSLMDLPLNTELNSRFPTMLVYSTRRLLQWKELSQKSTYVMQSPFVLYRKTAQIQIAPDAQGTVVFFGHLTEGKDRIFDIEAYMDQLEALEAVYQPITICLHFEDIKRGYHAFFIERGFACTTAGNWGDPNFVNRFYDILKKNKYATSNTMGSYAYYAAEMGIPFFICGEEPQFINYGDPNVNMGVIYHLNDAINRKVTEVFSTPGVEVTLEQRKITEEELGIVDGAGRFKMARILYTAFFQYQYNLLKSKFRIKSLGQFSFKEAIILVLGTIISRVLYLLPHFDRYLKQKQFFDELYLNGDHVIKKEGKNIIVLEDSINAEQWKVLIRRNTSDYIVFKQVWQNLEYKPLVDMILSKQKAEQIDYIVDAGANIGLTSLYLKRHFRNSRIIAVEPDEENFKSMRKNIELNNMDNIHLVQGAVWNTAEDLVIDKSFRDGAEWALAVKPKMYIHDVSVKSVTLLSLLEQYNFPYVDILKMDIEGAERYIFEDPEVNKLILAKVKYIAIEIHDEFKIKKHMMEQFEINGFVCEEYGETVIGYNTNLILKKSTD